jgi:undecaprenyl pyrophosphate phosphatase UppP
MQTIQTIIGYLYYAIAAVIGIVIVANFVRSRDVRKMLLYAIVLSPFVLRVLRVK